MNSPETYFFDNTFQMPPELIDQSLVSEKKENSNDKLRLSGYLKFSSSYHFANDKPEPGNPDFTGINELETSLFLRLDLDLSTRLKARIDGKVFYDWIYGLKGREKYTDQALDTYEADIELRNCYLEGVLTDRIDLKIGRQVVIWGEADSFRVTDILNPIDYLEPGREELSEVRLPISMAKLDYYTGPFNISAIATFEDRWNRYPVFGSRFYPFDFPINDDDEDATTLSDMDYAIAVKGSFSGSDMSIYMADYKEKAPYIKMAFPLPVFQLLHARVKMIGGDINYAWKNMLFKAEAAYFSGVRFSDYIDQPLELIRISNQTFEKTKILGGIEYMGFKDIYLAFEAVNTRIIGYDSNLERSGVPKNNFQISAKLIHTFLNGAATMTLHSVFGGDPVFSGKKGQEGSIHQIKMSYDLSDDLTLSGGILFFESGNSLLYKNLGDKDMLFFDLKYYF